MNSVHVVYKHVEDWLEVGQLIWYSGLTERSAQSDTRDAARHAPPRRAGRPPPRRAARCYSPDAVHLASDITLLYSVILAQNVLRDILLLPLFTLKIFGWVQISTNCKFLLQR